MNCLKDYMHAFGDYYELLKYLYVMNYMKYTSCMKAYYDPIEYRLRYDQ